MSQQSSDWAFAATVLGITLGLAAIVGVVAWHDVQMRRIELDAAPITSTANPEKEGQ